MAQLEDDENPIYFKIETKREYIAATTQSLATIPTTKLIEELKLQGI